MKKSEILQEIRKMKFEEVYSLRTERKLSVEEAATILGVCGRTFRRYVAQYKENGLDGLDDDRLGKAAHNAAPVDEVIALTTLYGNSYVGYSAAHFFDKYRLHHQGSRSYNWVRNRLQKQGVLTKAKKRGKHRRKRPRKPMVGMMIHQDASSHEWVEGNIWDLVVTLDDANNEIYSAFFVDEEGTWSSFQGIQEVIQKKGLPCSFYSDRGAHYWHTKKAGGKVDKTVETQFVRAMKRLGIEMIAAYSPQARGRSERMFRTLQGRLPLELQSAGISNMEGANTFLKERFLPEFNALHKKPAEDERSAFVPWTTSNILLDDILCIQNERTVNNDNTVSYKGKKFQIPKSEHRFSFAKTTVKIHEYKDGDISIFHGPRKLVTFEKRGEELDVSKIMLRSESGNAELAGVSQAIK